MFRNERELLIMDKVCGIVNEVLLRLSEMVKPGVSTLFLDKKAYEFCREYNAEPAFLGYSNYPATLCISINDEVVHGIPREDKVLKEGDIVSLDFGALKDGFYGDAAITLGVGKINYASQRLIETTKDCLKEAIKHCRVGNKLGMISSTIQKIAEKEGYSVIRDYVGHGIGTKLHEPPPVPNYGNEEEGPFLEEGMVLAIEPMVCEGGYEVEVDEDGWTVRTKDGKNSAHFECCVAITKEGPKILGSNII
ncbi:MAG: type I methionyl aminopeptidase [Thermoanaerobaculia bacterium]